MTTEVQFMRRPIRYIILVVAILPALALMYVSASCGLLLTPDSEQYLSAARELNSTGHWPGDEHSTYLYWPPLFPIILSFFDDPILSIRFFNTIILLGIGFFIYQLSMRIIQSDRIRFLFVGISMLNVHLLMISVFLWSELIFTLLMVVSLYCFFKTSEDPKYFAWLLISLSLLCLQRYVGLLIAAGIAACSFFYDTSGSRKQRLVNSVFLLVLPATLVFIWWSYVNAHHPDLNAINRFSFSSALLNMQLLMQSLSQVFFPIPGFVGITLFVTTIVVLIYSLRKPLSEVRELKEIAKVIIIYLTAFVFLGDLNVDEADRFISAIVPLLMLIAFFLFESVYLQNKKHVRTVLMLLLCLWMAYPVYRSVKNVLQWRERSCAQRMD